jgi:WD40 repeat protein/energy-coupling factor transporter ATP-binding protein EcfA2
MVREALVVGINRYPTLIEKPNQHPPHLQAPASDAEAIAQILESYGNFRVQRLPVANHDEVSYIDGRQLVKKTELEKAIIQLFNPPGRHFPETGLLFFAGHGLRKDQGGVSESFLATSDTCPLVGDWGISLDWLRKLLQSSPVQQQIVWLDCCYSGELLNFQEANPGILGNKDRCLIAASLEFQVAYEEFSGEHGILSRALLTALKPDNHAEAWITNYTLVESIKQQLRTGLQRPIFHNTGREIILTGEKEKIDHAVLTAGVCPYKGLEPFEFNEQDPKYFYGRTALTDTLLDKVRQSNFVAVVGASGSGKSSVVKAGLLHELKLGQKLGGSEQWMIKVFRPGEHPLMNLARVFVNDLENPSPNLFPLLEGEALNVSSSQQQKELVQSPISANKLNQQDEITTKQPKSALGTATQLINQGVTGLTALVATALSTVALQTPVSRRLILVVDQFEEVFTLCQGEQQRQKFFECLLGALDNSQLTLVITMRADFFGKCAEQEYAGLAQKIQENLIAVTPMSQQELIEAITKPAYLVGLEVQGELVEQMLADVTGPGSLPLLQYTLTELWHQREVNCLTLAQYTRLGGIKGTLQKQADEVYEALDPHTEQLVAKRIFLELTQLGEGTEDTRRQILKTDLINAQQSAEVVERVLMKLTDARLFVTSELQTRGESDTTVTVVDVAHEALIRHWTRLRNWIGENRIAIRIERKIEAAAQEWENHQRSKDYLLVGVKLIEAENYLQEYQYLGLLSHLASEFVQKSIRQRNRSNWLRFGVAASFFIGVIAMGAIESRKLTLAISSMSMSAQALLNSDQAFDALLASLRASRAFNQISNYLVLSSFEEKDNIQKQINSVLEESVYRVIEQNRLYGHDNEIIDVSFSPDNQIVATASKDKTVKLWDLHGKNIKTLKNHTSLVHSVSFSPDGQTIATASWDGKVRLWKRSGELMKKLEQPNDAIYSVNFSPDGQMFVAAGTKGNITLWTREGKKITSFHGHSEAVYDVIFSPNSKIIATASADTTVKLWNLNGQEIQSLRGHRDWVWSVSFSPNNQKIATASKDGTIKLWNIDGQVLQTLNNHKNSVTSVMFSPDGQTFASASSDKTAILWQENGEQIQTFKGHKNWVWKVSFSPDGQRIATASKDGTVKVWQVKGKRLQIIPAHSSAIYSVSYSPDGQRIATASWDKTVKLWTREGLLIKTINDFKNIVTDVSFSPNGQIIATATNEGDVKLLTKEGQLIKTFKAHNINKANTKWIWDVSFSPDSQMIATASADGTVKLWTTEGKYLRTLRAHDAGVNSVSFSPDGQTIATASWDQTVKLWTREGKIIQTLKEHIDGVYSVTFSPNSQMIASASEDKTVKLWTIKGELVKTIKGHNAGVYRVRFSPDGKTIATASLDNTVRLWNLEGKELRTYQGHNDSVFSLNFSPDGLVLASGDNAGNLILRDLDLTAKDLVEYGCNWVRDYLKNNPDVTKSDKTLCD